jgi:hypothetical protein
MQYMRLLSQLKLLLLQQKEQHMGQQHMAQQQLKEEERLK